jgi:hypothetical protein
MPLAYRDAMSPQTHRLIPRLTPQRAQRLRHGLTLNEVAFVAGLSPSLLSEFERGKAILSEEEDAARRKAISKLAAEHRSRAR